MTKNTARAFLLALVLPLLLAGCAREPTLSTPDSGASSQVTQARAVLNEQLNRAPFIKGVVFAVDPGEPRVMNYTDPSTG